ncbi:MAG: DUF58 domain-containing protein [Candidatus Omnitrophota bacterium]|nr:MAG: DUF58 domain-containing protein [Candidatus Omnitrophota bacterium]
MIPKDVLKKILRIEITTSRMVSEVFGGEYLSVFKGRGMEFEEVREYQPGDEIRSIDWNVTARMGHPFVKKFVEERELTVMLLLDMSQSFGFATANKLKNQIAAELCSLLALSAIRNKDKVGLIIFTDRIEKFIPARKGLRHVLRIIREALYFKPQGKSTDIAGVVEYLNKVTVRSTVSFIISDFYAKEFKKHLSIANKRHDIVAITITDPKEIDLADIGLLTLRDPETEELFIIDTSDKNLRHKYHLDSVNRFRKRKELFNSIGIDHIDIRTDIPYAKTLISFFRMRERRKKLR